MQGTFVQIALFIINTIATLYVGAVLLRFLLQTARADFYNPLSQLVVKVTNPLLKPFRKVIPGVGGFDLAAIALAYVAQILFIWIMQIVAGGHAGLYGGLIFVWAALALAMLVLGIYMISMLIVAIASFVAPYSSNFALLLMRQIIEPICAPVRNLIPPMGGFDLSFMVVAMGIYILRMLVAGTAHSYGIPL
ncbi:MAG TPA: YggT family protein [Marinagarivorans sp.]